MFSLTIPELLQILLDILIIIAKIAFWFVIIWLAGRVILWIIRSLIIPIFQRRAYFYAFKEDSDGFYVEKPLKILWFKLRRNKRWALQKDLVGYVSKSSGSSDNDSSQDKIFYMGFFSKTEVGQVKKPKERTDPNGGKSMICEVILKRSNLEGDTYYDAPIGFINDKGEVYKYYNNRSDALKGKKMDKPELIGYARSPKLGERKKYPGEYDTDVKAAKEGIDDTEAQTEWYFFRKRKKSKVKAQKINTQNTNKGEISLWTLGWRVLHAHCIDKNPERKQRPWGVGYAVEDFWRNLSTKDTAGFGLDARAVAALLLAEKEGFYLRSGEQGADGQKSWAPTALLALVCYICSFPYWMFLNGLLSWISPLDEWFPAFGPQLSTVIALILLFFLVWYFIHIIRLICYGPTAKFESLLYKINNNVGTANWNTWLIVASAIGLILSFFVVDYLFTPIFVCALIAIITNTVRYSSIEWDIESPYNDSDSDEEEQKDDGESDEKIEHTASIFSAGGTRNLNFAIPFKEDGLKDLRAKNPFREGNTAEYAQRVKDMLEQEYGNNVYSKIKFVKDRVDSFVSKHHLSFLEKVNLILKLAQPDNVKYEYDSCCPELLPQSDEPQPADYLLEDRSVRKEGAEGKGYIEYCRYPTEALHDKRGDCDCHAALAAGLLSACGIRCCFFTNHTDDDTGHAAIGIEVDEDIKKFANPQNIFDYNNISFIYTETTGKDCAVGEVPPGFQKMLENPERGTFAIIEPAIFNNEETKQ